MRAQCKFDCPGVDGPFAARGIKLAGNHPAARRVEIEKFAAFYYLKAGALVARAYINACNLFVFPASRELRWLAHLLGTQLLFRPRSQVSVCVGSETGEWELCAKWEINNRRNHYQKYIQVVYAKKTTFGFRVLGLWIFLHLVSNIKIL